MRDVGDIEMRYMEDLRNEGRRRCGNERYRENYIEKTRYRENDIEKTRYRENGIEKTRYRENDIEKTRY